MSRLPRFAVGTVQPDVQSQLILWGLLDILDRSGIRVQRFASRACFQPLDAAATITGQLSRHLDSWLMTADLPRKFFLAVRLLATFRSSMDSSAIQCRPRWIAGNEILFSQKRHLSIAFPIWLVRPRVAISKPYAAGWICPG